jgi:hypothetical protein
MNGKERMREIREPFGSGIDKNRETEAIRQILRALNQTLKSASFRERKVEPKLRATNQQYQSKVALRRGQARRSTGYGKLDAHWYGFIVSDFEIVLW